MQTICSRFHASCCFSAFSFLYLASFFLAFFFVRFEDFSVHAMRQIYRQALSSLLGWCHRCCPNAKRDKHTHTVAHTHLHTHYRTLIECVFWGQHTPFNTHYDPELNCFVRRWTACVGLNYVGNVIVRFNTTTRDDINFHQHHVAVAT